MRISKVLTAVAGASIVAAGPALAGEGVEAAPSAATFSLLSAVEAQAMSAEELSAVKGEHFHFHTRGQPEETHLVNVQLGKLKKDGEFVPTPNYDIAPDGRPVGKGYRGLCVASSVGAISISPPPASLQCN